MSGPLPLGWTQAAHRRKRFRLELAPETARSRLLIEGKPLENVLEVQLSEDGERRLRLAWEEVLMAQGEPVGRLRHEYPVQATLLQLQIPETSSRIPQLYLGGRPCPLPLTAWRLRQSSDDLTLTALLEVPLGDSGSPGLILEGCFTDDP